MDDLRRKAGDERRRYRKKRRTRLDQEPQDSDDSGGNPASPDNSEISSSDGDISGSVVPKRPRENDSSSVSINSSDENQGAGGEVNAEHQEDLHDQALQNVHEPAESNSSDSDSIRQGQGVRVSPEPAGFGDATSSSEINSSEEEQKNEHSESDQSDTESEHDSEPEDQPLLYDGAELTVMESLLSILTFALTHQLTGAAIADLLGLIILHCRPNNLCCKTLYKFKKYFALIGDAVVKRHHYCSGCEVPLVSKDIICNLCQGRHPVSFFIEFPIVEQLRSMFSRPGFTQSLAFRFERKKKSAANIEDIYDSVYYKEQIANGFLQNPNNITFFMYFDGVSLFKSSKFSIWPVYFTINELKYTQRTQKENIVLASLWFGKSKPNPNLFLKPLSEKLVLLEKQGAELTLPGDQGTVRVRCKLLAGVADMPAKSTFMRLKQYNANYSCFYCLTQGSKYHLPNGPGIQVFPYNRNFELRINNDIPAFAEQAMNAHQAVFGVKGPSHLYAMLPNMINCMACDIMHGVFLGVTKLLCTLWFDSQHSGNEYCISTLTDIVDARLKTMKPPDIFQRIPRSVKTELALFKAADYKNFFFYYSLPVLSGVLPDRYWVHHCKLVSAIAVLCQDSISEAQINDAERLIHSYVQDFQVLYGLRYMTLTLHQLLHLPMNVRNLGNLWVYSCFFYESLNGQISKLVHGTRHAALQICSTSSVYLNLPCMIDKLRDGSAVKDFCIGLRSKKQQRLRLLERIDDFTFALGTYKHCHPIPQNLIQSLQDINIFVRRCDYFFRLQKKGILYTSERYSFSHQKDSYHVEVFHNGSPILCKILYFIRVQECYNGCGDYDCNCQKSYFCVTTTYERQPWEAHDVEGAYLQYAHKVTPSFALRLFPVEEIRSPCIYIKINDNEYVMLPINSLEIE